MDEGTFNNDLDKMSRQFLLLRNCFVEEEKLRKELERVVNDYKDELSVCKAAEREERIRYTSSQKYIANQQEIVVNLLSVKSENLKLQTKNKELEDEIKAIKKKLSQEQQDHKNFQNEVSVEKQNLQKEQEVFKSAAERKINELTTALRLVENSVTQTKYDLKRKLSEKENEKNEELNITKFLYEEKLRELENSLKDAHSQNREFQNEANAIIAAQKGRIMELETSIENLNQKIATMSTNTERYNYAGLQTKVSAMLQKNRRVNFSKEYQDMGSDTEEGSPAEKGAFPHNMGNLQYSNVLKLKQRLPTKHCTSSPLHSVLKTSNGKKVSTPDNTCNGERSRVSFLSDSHDRQSPSSNDNIKSIPPSKKRKLFSHSSSEEL